MNALSDVKSYMSFWGWTDGGGTGSVKYDVERRVIARHGGAMWIADVEEACAILKRLQDRLATTTTKTHRDSVRRVKSHD